MDILDYAMPKMSKPARWRRRYLVSVPTIAVSYSLFTIAVEWPANMSAYVTPEWLVKVLAFPLLYLTESTRLMNFLGPYLGRRPGYVLLLGNSLIWAFGIVGVWHLVSIVLRARKQ